MKQRMKKWSFTLIELLVVIGIIAILMALLFPVVQGAKDQSRKVKARLEIKQLETAWKALLTDNRCWPSQVNPSTLDKMDIAAVVVLTSNNPNRVMYLELGAASYATNQGMIDPWKRVYQVKLDDNYDNVVAVSKPVGGNTTVAKPVAVWSLGPNANTAKDDINNW